MSYACLQELKSIASTKDQGAKHRDQDVSGYCVQKNNVQKGWVQQKNNHTCLKEFNFSTP